MATGATLPIDDNKSDDIPRLLDAVDQAALGDNVDDFYTATHALTSALRRTGQHESEKSTRCGCGYRIVATPDGWQHDAAPYFWGDDHGARPIPTEVA